MGRGFPFHLKAERESVVVTFLESATNRKIQRYNMAVKYLTFITPKAHTCHA